MFSSPLVLDPIDFLMSVNEGIMTEDIDEIHMDDIMTRSTLKIHPYYMEMNLAVDIYW